MEIFDERFRATYPEDSELTSRCFSTINDLITFVSDLQVPFITEYRVGAVWRGFSLRSPGGLEIFGFPPEERTRIVGRFKAKFMSLR